ncbi:MAG: hypothetical protein V7635_2261 [Arthrobacter sp.]
MFHRGWFHACVAHIHHQVEALPQVVGALHNHVQGLEALRRHMALGRYFGLSAFEVEPDENLELVVQNAFPFAHGRNAATAIHHRDAM